MSANIGLSLSATKLEVAPGESVEATITIRNQSQIVDQFGIRIQGLSPTWWTLSTPSVSLFPGDQGEAKLTIHPPKEVEARAGSYSFQVRAVSQANPEEMTVEEAYLILRGFLVWDVEMSPTKVVGRSGTYRLTASNSGNTDITLIFEGKDPEEALNYTFSHDKVTVPAGESALITLKVHPKKGERGKLYSFQVLVRPAEAKVPSREIKTINGQLEYQRRRCPWKWILLVLALVAVAFLVWKFILPVPVIDFAASQESITAGDSSTLSWDVSGATAVTINQEIGSVNLTGTYIVYPTTTTTYTLEASTALGRSSTATVQVTVTPFAVTSVTASVSPSSFTGVCPKTFNFSAVITVNGPGTVTYKWERSDDATVPTESITFTAAGSRTVTKTWTLSAAGTRWQRIRILTPNEMVSNEATFTLACEAPFAVTSATASVSPSSFTGVCPKTFTFSAIITVNGPGTVTYRWERSDGATAPIESITFTAAGSRTVTTTWTLSAVGTHWRLIRILTPNEMVSNKAAFTLSCVS